MTPIDRANDANASHPGAVLANLLVALSMTPAAFADAVGLPRSHVADLCACRARVGHDLAAVLQHAFGQRAHTWLALQKAHDGAER